MRLGARLGWTSLLAVVLLAATAPATAAATQTVETPAGTYHVVYAADADPPETDDKSICVPYTQICLVRIVPVPQGLGSASVEVGLWVEANGCEGLQTEPSDCDDDGETEDGDRPILHVSEGY